MIRSAIRSWAGDLEGLFGDPTRIPARGAGWASWAGVSVNERRALQQVTVWSCTSLISDLLSTLELGTFTLRNGDPVRIPNPSVIERPHPDWERYEWLGAGLMSILIRGNSYGQVVERDGMGFPTMIMPRHPDEVQPIRKDGRVLYIVAGEREALTKLDVFHVKGLVVPGPASIKGLSPIEYAMRQVIATSLAAEEFGARWFGDGGHPSSMLTSKGKITPEDAEAIQARFLQNHGDRHRKPLVAGGGLEWKAIQIAPNESQFLETIEALRGEICGFYRTPPHLVADVHKMTSWGTGLEEITLGFITFGLMPWVIRWETKLSALLPAKRFVKFNMASLLRGRLLDRYSAYLKGRQGNFITIDDIREAEGMPKFGTDWSTDPRTPINSGGGGLSSDSGNGDQGQPPPSDHTHDDNGTMVPA